MSALQGFQKQYLKGQAHHLRPTVTIGKQGLTDAGLAEIDRALNVHELIKVRFAEFKQQKREFCREIETRLSSELIGLVGNVAIFFRQNEDPEQRKIVLPGRSHA